MSDIVFAAPEEGGLGFAFRSQPEVDVGIDGHIELVDRATGEVTGKLVGVQIKAGASFFTHPVADGWTVYITKSTVNYWRQYAVPVVMTVVDLAKRTAYWVLVSEGAFEETADSYKIVVPERQRLDASAADAIAALATQAPTALLAQLSALVVEVSAATAEDLVRHQTAWREGRRADTRDWLNSLVRAPARLAALDAPIAARLLRYAAAVTLDEGGNVAAAQAWIEEAARRDPAGDDARLRAAMLVRSGDVSGAVALLAAASSPNAQILRASLLSHMGDQTAAADVLDRVLGPLHHAGVDNRRPDAHHDAGAGASAGASAGRGPAGGTLRDAAAASPSAAASPVPAPPVGTDGAGLSDADRSEAWRVRARLRVAAGDLPGALNSVAHAEALTPRYASVRHLRATLAYLGGLASEAIPESIPRWPQPIPDVFRRRDAEAVTHFLAAADAFAHLLTLDWTAEERRHLEAWRLAALVALPAGEAAATAFAREVLARDPSQPFVLLLAASEALPLDLSPHLDALTAEADRTGDLEIVLLAVAARMTAGALRAGGRLRDAEATGGAGAAGAAGATADVHGHALGPWMERWRPEFAQAGGLAEWRLWRGRVHAAAGEYAEARALLPTLEPPRARALEAEILTAEARETGDDRALAAYLEVAARESGDAQFLLEAARAHAAAGRWDAVAPHADELLRRVPTPAVRRLAAFARFHTRDYDGCAALLDEALSPSRVARDQLEPAERLELLRMRADVRGRLGDLLGEIDDLRATVAEAPPPTTHDLLALARALFFAGQTHELASCARDLRRHADLDAQGALMLCEALAHDDPALAREFWHRANARGVADADVPGAVTLGYQLRLETHLRDLQTRMFALAAAGASSIQQVTIDELIDRQRGWVAERERLLTQYRQGEVATQVVAQFLNEPLVHLYHVVPGANEATARLRDRFALQFRDGGRGQPDVGAGLAAPGRLALDVSALLLAAHLEILPELEAQFAPLQVPQLVIVALRDQRDKLRPHQPSRLDVVRRLLNAERGGHVRTWEGELPDLTADERSTAAQWAPWVALLERARRESAYVVDLPLGPDSPHGRPAHVAGAARLERLLTPDDIRRFLYDAGLLDTSDDRPADPESAARGASLRRGAVVYLTDGGAEALAEADLLARAAEVLTLLVDPDEQVAQRAQLDALPELAERVEWMEALIRRVADGLTDGRYALLPPGGRRWRREPAEGEETAHLAGVAHNEFAAAMPNDAHAAADASDGGGGQGPDDAPAGPKSGTADDSDASHETDEVGADQVSEDGRELPLALRCLADLVSLPPGSVDAVCIDDRWLNRHRLAGTTRITDTLEVLSALEAAGRITAARRWTLYLRLRAANVRVVPLSSAEIGHHLRAAPFTDGAIAETRALHILRQYGAALLADLDGLHVPPPDQLALGTTGELEVVRSYTSAVREALLDTWRWAADSDADAARARAEAESAWLVDNLYVDLALLRARAVTPSGSAELGISALDAASLLTAVVSLLPSVTMSTAGSDAVAVAYTAWVYDHIIAPRGARDAAFRSALVDHLRTMLTAWIERAPRETADAHETSMHEALTRMLVARVFDTMPAPLRDRLQNDTALMARLGRVILSSLDAGHWSVETDAFSEAAAGLLARETGDASRTERIDGDPAPLADGATEARTICHDAGGPQAGSPGARAPGGVSSAGVELRILGSEPPQTILLSHTGPDTFSLVSRDGRETVQLRDPVFGLLAPSIDARRRACEAVRGDADVSVEEWRAFTDHVIALESPGARLQAVTAHRVAAMPARYEGMSARWAAQGRIDLDDLRPPSVSAVLRHLRLAPGEATAATNSPTPAVAGPVRRDREHGAVPQAVGTEATAAADNDARADDGARWAAAAAVLLAEEGLEVTFDRLSGVPRPLPEPLRRALDALAPDARHRFARRLLRTPTSPIGAAHAIRVLAVFGATDDRYLRAARRVARLLVSRRGLEYVALLREVAVEADRVLTFDEPADVPTDDSLDATTTPPREATPAVPLATAIAAGRAAADRLVASWYHTHRVLSGVCAASADPAGLVRWLKNRAAVRSSTSLFAREERAERDVAHPCLVGPARFVVAAAQYASAGTGLLRDAEALVSTLLTAVTCDSPADCHDDAAPAEGAEQPSGAEERDDGTADQRDSSRVPHLDLFRDVGDRPNRIGAWLEPVREIDGTICLGSWRVVPSSATPQALAARALEALKQDMASPEGWFLLEVVYGSDPLAGDTAVRFREVTGDADLPAMLPALGRAAIVAAARLARETYGAAHAARRDRLREALLALAAPGGVRAEPGAAASRPGTPRAPEGKDELTDQQHAILGALYLLAQAEPRPGDAVRRFAKDLADLARADAAYPRRVRTVVERLMRERPLDEAQACLALLIEARSV